MAVFPLLLTLVLLFLIFHHFWGDRRHAFIAAMTAWAGILVFLTEVLNWWGGITYTGLLTAWGIVAVGLILVCGKLRISMAELRSVVRVPALGKLDRFAVVAVAVMAGVLAFIGLMAAPNNWDSMTYHLVRVAHWSQNHSVMHYPANFLPQLWMNPGSEFIILHLYVLADGDRMAAMVQWMSMVGSIVAVSLIARQMGAGMSGQVLAGVFCATLPAGILQATSTQTDYAVAFWLTCLGYFLIRIVTTDRLAWSDAYFAGTALGMAILTKGNAYLFALPLLIWFFLWSVRGVRVGNQKTTRLIGSLAVILGLCLALNLGYYARNMGLFGRPLGSETGAVVCDRFGLGVTVSNLLRYIMLLLITPWQQVNIWMVNAVAQVHSWLSLNPADPQTTVVNRPFGVPALGYNEIYAPNPIHTLWIVAAIGGIFFSRHLRALPKVWSYLLAIACAMLLLCTFLRWDLTYGRLMLPLLILAAAPVAIASQWLAPRAARAGSIILLVLAIPWVLCNETRPLVGGGRWNILTCPRLEQYFAARPDVMQNDMRIVAALRQRGYQRIGLSLAPDTYEYTYYVLMQAGNPNPVRIENVGVTNISGTKYRDSPFNDFQPQATIATPK